MNIIITKNVRKIYRMGENNVYALNGVDFTVKEGEFVAIVGASGSGKSTLLNLLGAMDSPTEGEIFVRGIPLAQMSQNEQTIFRRRNIGFIFQDFKLLPVLNVYDNMVLPLKLDGRKIDREFAEMLLKSLGLQNKREQTPYTLSGGEQQRVAIARALITRPAVVLADEPTGNLDSRTGMEVIGLMKILAQKFYQTLVVVTHDEEVAQTADRIVHIEDGKICQEGESI
ncbi:ABC transporter ATP-binding protein [Sellimonas catena]|uniref:ABC transporter ATP-binding protein n=1 Tax=Sellimonas catena TaxID=2994035 RepID=A0A9W6CD50_9FIRM|nr:MULTISPECIES: ABC transporter ATP-binding protein [Clostridia]GLG05671.1 ABC transporter ATP-binding protein [Sellimonas catena]GLG92043.1 ABC transporter ATP-binding protein [Sellimonas catena]